MKILQWNINGIKNNNPDLLLQTKIFLPDIVCLQETHLKINEEPTLKGFEWIHRSSLNSPRAKGGVAIGIRNGIPYKELHIASNLEVIATNITSYTNFTICCIYIPPTLHIEYEDIINIIDQLPSPYIFLGDFNAHSTLWGCQSTNHKGNILEKCLSNRSLMLLNNGSPTYISPAYGTMSAIDITMCSPELYMSFTWSTPEDTYGSDHYPIYLKSVKETPPPPHFPHWCLKKAKWDEFQRKIEMESNVLQHNCNDTVKIITGIIINAANDTIPKTKPKAHPPVPWFTNAVKEAIKKRKSALKMFKRNMTDLNLKKYMDLKKEAKAIIFKEKKECWMSYASQINSVTPISKMWEMVRRITRKPTNKSIHCLMTPNGLTNKPNEMINHLSKHFSNTSHDNNYSDNFRTYKVQQEQNPLPINLDFIAEYNLNFTLEEFEWAISSVKGTAPGADNIPYAMIQHLPNGAKAILLQFYNKIWAEGSFPHEWNKSIIIPIIKPNKDPKLAESYRPIALTSCVCKILEKMVNRRLIWELETRGLIIPEQCGFRTRRSTLNNLIKLENDIQLTFSNKKHLIAIFYDINKAYDTVWRRGILNELYNLGFNGRLLQFLANFLQDRYAQVRYGSLLSAPQKLQNGVPQGSVLSVTLFIIAMNAITKNQPVSVKACIYADDIVLYSSSKHLDTIANNLNESINQLNIWASLKGFSLAPNKTKAMHFTKLRKYNPLPKFKLNSLEIPYVTHTTFLGMEWDNKLNWIQHIKSLKTKCLHRLSIIKYLASTTWGADRKTLLKLHKTLILSKIDYGAVVYGGATLSHLKMLDTVHTQGIRLATGALVTSPSISILVEAGEQPLSNRRDKQLVKTCNKIKEEKLNPNRNALRTRKFTRFLKKQRPLCLRFQAIQDKIPGPSHKIAQIKVHNPSPPWQQIKFVVDFHFKKKKCSPLEVEQDLRQRYSSTPIAYTDGSANPSGAGSAFIIENNTFMFGLPPGTSNFSAEAFAIWKCIEYVNNLSTTKPNYRNFVIATDSKSTLDSIFRMNQTKFHSHPYIQNIYSILSKSTAKITLVWIPAHQGIRGNEAADRAAKMATTLPYNISKIPSQDSNALYIHKINSEWSREWASVQENKLREIKDTTIAWNDSYRANRWEEVALCRLRIGHTLQTHEHIFSKKEPPTCQKCGATPLTVKHFLTQCPNNTNSWMSLKEALTIDISDVLKFIKEAQFKT